jgi:hypothetical protein
MDGSSIQRTEADKTQAFLSELTELSMKYGIGIAGAPILFQMERVDYDYPYRVDSDSRLSLG